MAQIQLRPDLKTAGGEVSDIMLDGRYVGAITLVYREGDRISGSIQLEKELLTRKEKDNVIPFAQDYVQSMIIALGAEDCDVVVTFSEYDHIITTTDIQDDFDLEDLDLYDDEDKLIDGDEAYYQLVIVGENRNQVEYHIYDGNHYWLAEAFMSIMDTDVIGEVNWRYQPSDEEIEHIAELIVSDFDEDEIDTFTIDMKFKNEILETIELTHGELLDDDDDNEDEEDEDDLDELEEDYYIEEHDDDGDIEFDEDDEDEDDEMAGMENNRFNFTGRSDYSIVLIRDDEDTLTYDIYKQSQGGIPIGTATIDMEKRHLTGFIEFRVPGNENDRQRIATMLMKELDKEKEYDKFNVTMLYNNKLIEEIIFTNETIH